MIPDLRREYAKLRECLQELLTKQFKVPVTVYEFHDALDTPEQKTPCCYIMQLDGSLIPAIATYRILDVSIHRADRATEETVKLFFSWNIVLSLDLFRE